MALSMVTAAVTLFYLSAVPIHIAVRLRLGSGSSFGIGFSAFEPRFAQRSALKRQSAGVRLPPFMKRPDRRALMKAAMKALKYASGHLRIDRAELSGTFGSDDAAVTALVCGGAAAIGNALRCATGREVRFSLQPDFSGGPLRAEVSGMISIRVGHIMLAALLGAYQYGSRRLKEWTSTPLKAS